MPRDMTSLQRDSGRLHRDDPSAHRGRAGREHGIASLHHGMSRLLRHVTGLQDRVADLQWLDVGLQNHLAGPRNHTARQRPGPAARKTAIGGPPSLRRALQRLCDSKGLPATCPRNALDVAARNPPTTGTDDHRIAFEGLPARMGSPDDKKGGGRFALQIDVAGAGLISMVFKPKVLLRKPGIGAFWGGSLVFLDQALRSSSTLIASILIGRACGKAEYGWYSLLVGMLVIISAIHAGLIGLPYIVLSRSKTGEPKQEYGASNIALAVGTAVALCLVFFAVAYAGSLVGAHTIPAGILVCFCLALVAVLFRDFVRQFLLAELYVERSLFLAMMVHLPAQSVLVLLYAMRALSPSRAFDER